MRAGKIRQGFCLWRERDRETRQCRECLGKEILTNWRENIDEDNLFVHHRRPMPAAGREVKHVSGRSDSFLAFNKEADTTP